jgi:DNA-binding Lrp family transcriptional regulator
MLNELDRVIINHLQDGIPVCEHPFAAVSEQLNITEDRIIERVQALLADGTLSRFGPLYDIEKIGGIYSLVAMKVSPESVNDVIAVINSYPEVAHNYERDHDFNLWFVVALDSEERLPFLLADIEERTGYHAYNMPKLDEYYVGLKFHA